MSQVVTAIQLETGAVTIDTPGGDILARAGSGLFRWQEQTELLAREMAKLQEAGIFLDPEGSPVVPGWWQRQEDGQHVAWYLVWPAGYARRAGLKRRQYVKAAEYEATRAKVERTLEYSSLKQSYDRLVRETEQAVQELARLVERYNW